MIQVEIWIVSMRIDKLPQNLGVFYLQICIPTVVCMYRYIHVCTVYVSDERVIQVVWNIDL